MRPLGRLTSIRAKLGSTIVFAVGMTLVLVFFLAGYALRNSPRGSELLEMYATARGVATGRLDTVPEHTTIVLRSIDGSEEVRGPDGGIELPTFTDQTPHSGQVEGFEYVSVPRVQSGQLTGTIYVIRPIHGTGLAGSIRATVDFLRLQWWPLLVAGAVAAVLALLMARLLALGMTKPLRDMAAAAHRMEMGDYGQRVETTSRDEVGRLAEAFNKMSAELAAVEQHRRDLVANVSHELKTPITAIRAHLENLLDGVEQPDPQTLGVMLAQTERLSRLVEQLLDLSRFESGDVPLDRTEVPLSALVEEVVSEIGVAGRGVAIDAEVPGDLPPVWADRERVHQVLFNLLDNAVRFTPSGGHVTVRASRHNGSCEVAVEDTGPGIRAEDVPRVFERFYRVGSSRSREDGGTGIGLAIVRSVVEAHGGHVRVESKPGEGSRFMFDLPVAPAAEGEVAR